MVHLKVKRTEAGLTLELRGIEEVERKLLIDHFGTTEEIANAVVVSAKNASDGMFDALTIEIRKP